MIRFRWLFILAILFPSLVYGQGVVYTYKVVDDGGNAIGGAVVTVCTSGASLANLPCTPKASIYTDPMLGTPLANPFVADRYGNLAFAAAAGTYIVSITGAFSPGYSFKVVLPGGITYLQGLYVGSAAADNGSDYITGLLANGSTLQTTRDVVGISNTSVWAPDTASPTNPYMFGYDGLTGFGLGVSNVAMTTAATAIGGYSDGIVALTTSGAGQTVSVTDMVGYVSNVPVFGGPGTMSATRKSGFWANNQGNSHVATSYGFRADAQSGSSVNNWGFFSATTNNDQLGILTVTSMNATPVTVASLPAAAAGNSGQWRTVSDSTAVSAEGQTCVGGNSNKAAAFSNGVVWKCF